jgi:hypothetical protein
MAQGLRGRIAMLGAGLLFCVGCMDNDPKPMKAPPKAQGATGLMGAGAKAGSSAGFANNGLGGAPQTGFNQTQNRTPALGNTPGYTPGSTNAPGNLGMAPISGQTVPGSYGQGQSMAPGGSVPPISPPTYSQKDSGYQGAYGAPPSNPPGLGYDVPMPPGAPGSAPGAGAPSYPVSPVGGGYPGK